MDNTELDGLVIRQADTIARLTEALEYIAKADGSDWPGYERQTILYELASRARQALALAKDTGQAPQSR